MMTVRIIPIFLLAFDQFHSLPRAAQLHDEIQHLERVSYDLWVINCQMLFVECIPTVDRILF